MSLLNETSQDKTLKCSVFRIKGPVPVNSYILIPKNTNQSLGLTGRYFYLLFRPTPGKYFVVHLDVAVEVGDLILLDVTCRLFIGFAAWWLSDRSLHLYTEGRMCKSHAR